ncbi:hypothetical protein A2Z33_03765 [Candidatus Gottesmanbacteria bacterium RBG_16_52_11]|uniref:LysM domain-containing protein n=1 Tax=Candidatus Gottesmanbacteria bacterium RBG_16_52_11 TaxID=1798374 RepID=A0A1F5YVM6_9BACT|nr:MAG: hypothetical protein A2Z33_03765 [Candidatus Gottesmanbacteria bacterium RBG_16_52_11]
MRKWLATVFDDIRLWSRGWYLYAEKKLRRFGVAFESQKSLLVDFLMARRGSYQRPFLHFSLGIIFVVGVMSAPLLTSSQPNAASEFTPPSAVLTSLDFSEYGIQTQISEKPRDQVITYAVQQGDTLSGVAEKFGISVDSVKWANDINRDALKVGQELKIPPVTGIIHKVREGETVYSIAKKYKTDAQKIVNFPFNDFTDLDTFALSAGQTLVVPDGTIADVPSPVAQARPPVTTGGTGQFQWPTNGSVSQYPIWYHMAVDIANNSAPPVVAADSGTVVVVQYLRYGYGFHVIIDHGNGFQTLYGHMSEIYVDPGDGVKRGQMIGKMGSTGRSTGTHLHFEVRKGGSAINPLGYLK